MMERMMMERMMEMMMVIDDDGEDDRDDDGEDDGVDNGDDDGGDDGDFRPYYEIRIIRRKKFTININIARNADRCGLTNSQVLYTI